MSCELAIANNLQAHQKQTKNAKWLTMSTYIMACVPMWMEQRRREGDELVKRMDAEMFVKIPRDLQDVRKEDGAT